MRSFIFSLVVACVLLITTAAAAKDYYCNPSVNAICDPDCARTADPDCEICVDNKICEKHERDAGCKDCKDTIDTISTSVMYAAILVGLLFLFYFGMSLLKKKQKKEPTINIHEVNEQVRDRFRQAGWSEQQIQESMENAVIRSRQT